MTATVQLDGRDVTGVTLNGVTITRGRESLYTDTRPGVCVATLLSGDIDPTAWQGVSGYVDEYDDTWVGLEVAARVGSSFAVTSVSVSGYVDEYDDTWVGAGNVRFTGTVTAVDYTPGEITITAVDALEQLGRVFVKNPRPAETDFSRAYAYAQTAGVPMGFLGDVTAPLVEQVTAPPRVTVLDAVHDAAENTAAVIYADRYNKVWYRRRDAALVNAVTAPPDVTLTDALVVSQELGDLFNTETVEFGPADNRRTATKMDPASVAVYGVREWPTMVTGLANNTDAQALAEYWLAIDKDAHYRVTNVVLVIYGEDQGFHSAADALDLFSLVNIPKLPAGSPIGTYSAVLLGYTETINENERRLDLHLAQSSYTPEGCSYAVAPAA